MRPCRRQTTPRAIARDRDGLYSIAVTGRYGELTPWRGRGAGAGLGFNSLTSSRLPRAIVGIVRTDARHVARLDAGDAQRYRPECRLALIDPALSPWRLLVGVALRCECKDRGRRVTAWRGSGVVRPAAPGFGTTAAPGEPAPQLPDAPMFALEAAMPP